MPFHSRLNRLTLVASLALAVTGAATAADGGVVEHVRVGGNVRETRGFSPSLLVDIAVLPQYRHVSGAKDLRGEWQGPAYHAETKADLGGTVTIDWTVYFTLGGLPSTVTQLTPDVKTFNWKLVPQATPLVPHVINGRTVGTLKGVAVLIRSPGSSGAAVKAGVTFPLCRGLVATAIFELMEPADDDAAPYGNYIVAGGTVTSTWNHDRALDALRQVRLNGYLPLARVTARAAGKTVRGTVTDCAGHPAPGVVVSVGSAHATTNAAGAYSAQTHQAGSYSATASAGGSTVKSSAVRVR